MPDYQELYFTLFRATEKAINELVAAQQKCEEMYLQMLEEEETAKEKTNVLDVGLRK